MALFFEYRPVAFGFLVQQSMGELSNRVRYNGAMETQLVQDNADGIAAAIKELQRGGVVGLPTETVYGLAADVTQLPAIKSIFVAKDRPLYDPLIVHVLPGALDQLIKSRVINLSSLSYDVRKKLDQLVARYWPGPLTLLLPKGEAISDLVTAGSTSVAIRAPAHSVFQAVLTGLGNPLAAPSANRFGHVSPTTAQHVLDDLAGRIPLIVDGGSAVVGVESTIIEVKNDGFDLLRPGGVASEEIAELIGPERLASHRSDRTIVPGTLEKHYAPDKPVFLVQPDTRHTLPDFSRGILLLPDLQHEVPRQLDQNVMSKLTVEYLTATDSDVEAAQNVYKVLRQVEGDTSCDLLAIVLPQQLDGLWPAIRDRLRRAATS